MAENRGVKLTPRQWANLAFDPAQAAGKKEVIYKDTVTRGLELRLSPTSRAWRYRYRYASQEARRITIGDANLIGYDAAKKQADSYNLELDHGRDPSLIDYRPKTASTLRHVVDHYMTKLSDETTTKDNVARVVKRLLTDHGDRPLINLDSRLIHGWLNQTMWRAAIASDLQKISSRKMASSLYRHVNGGVEVRACGLTSALVRYMTSAFNRAMSPISGLDMPPGYKNPFSNMLSELTWMKDYLPDSYARSWGSEEWKDIMAGLDACYLAARIKDTLDHRSGPSPTGLRCLHLIMLTGTRPEEIQSLRWDQLEPCSTVIGGTTFKVARIVKDRHKTWGKTGRPRQIIVAKLGMKVLEDQKNWLHANGLSASPWVFPTPGGKRTRKDGSPAKPYLADVKDYAKAVSERCQRNLDLQTYNFRSAYINFALDSLGMNWLEVVAENVGHVNSSTTLRYYQRNRLDKLIEGAVKADHAFAEMIGSGRR
ncbi:MAG: integrase arm-type DNA-binding domain-containing protein [Rhodospirillaceae bacterium]|nr:integrase arm-type DNA-binding domain-containing protein [Rhodospirillales bacterium]